MKEIGTYPFTMRVVQMQSPDCGHMSELMIVSNAVDPRAVATSLQLHD